MTSEIAFCFIDIEGTGLDAQQDVPLELGLALVSADLEIITSKSWLIWEEGQYKAAEKRGRDNEFVNNMHTKSGLWSDLQNPGLAHWSRREADDDATDWLYAVGCPPDKKIPLAGSSIGSYDRPFVLEHFPGINNFLSYRNVDVSSIKELCKAWNPVLFERMLPQIGTKEDALHRVLDDIEASVNELNVYRENFFFID